MNETAAIEPGIDFGRDVSSNLAESGWREWLVTNGAGGYASGTIAHLLTRRYHGLLVAALKPPVRRHLLLTKLDETVLYGGQRAEIYCNKWRSGEVEPAGFRYLERFRLEGAVPVWTYAVADALLEKRVWMAQGANTSYVLYNFRRGVGPLHLEIKVIANGRDHHGITRADGASFSVTARDHGLALVVNGIPFVVLSDRAAAVPAQRWYRGYYLNVEAFRGLEPVDDHIFAGTFHVALAPGERVCLVASTEPEPPLDSDAALAERRDYEAGLRRQALRWSPGLRGAMQAESRRLEQLLYAADQFVVRRPTLDDPDGKTIVAGYHWFTDWGRDTMIALPGLTLTTGRAPIAASILRTFAAHVSQGMLPNRFPDEGEAPEYNTVDATLWYLEAVRAYHAVTGDDALLKALYPTLKEIIDWHIRGTRYQIKMDPADSLISAGEPGVQLTWMDAKVGDWVVTPRIGKPVEINALWYNGLRAMAEFAGRLWGDRESYDQLADQVRASFDRYWFAAGGYCFDVIDGPGLDNPAGPPGSDPALRPNQLLAVSLPHSPLSRERQQAVVDRCARHLLTSHGLRSLAPANPDYQGSYGGDQRRRDAAYHQGTVWAWLIGPFAAAHYRVYGDQAVARSFMRPLLQHLSDHGVGTVSEIFEGDPPFSARGCIAQAWSVAELLRVWVLTGGATAEPAGETAA